MPETDAYTTSPEVQQQQQTVVMENVMPWKVACP